jgi:hypothetical protein
VTVSTWDTFYEHRSYLAEPAPRGLFERAGFTVTAAGASFSSQYQWMEGRPGHRARPTLGRDGDAHGELAARSGLSPEAARPVGSSGGSALAIYRGVARAWYGAPAPRV